MAVTIDKIFEKIGEFRQYQWYILTLMGYFLLSVGAFNAMIAVFITAEPEWKCVDGYMNNTVCRFNKSITLTSDDYKARCKMPREAWTFVDDFTSIVTEVGKQPKIMCVNSKSYICLQLISYNFSANVANFVPNFVVKFKSSY